MRMQSTLVRSLAPLVVIALSAVLAGCQPEGFVYDPQSGRWTSPLPTTTPPTSPLPTLKVTSGPTPTPYPSLRPPDFTPSPTPTPSATPEGAPVIITDPEGNFSLQLLPGWHAHVGGTTSIINYDDENLSDVHAFPAGGLKIQMGVGELEPGQSFEQWLSNWRVIESSPDSGVFGVALTEPQPYKLGDYDGVTYFVNDIYGGDPIMEIVLSLSGRRVMSIALTPADSPVLPEALSMLSAIEISTSPAVAGIPSPTPWPPDFTPSPTLTPSATSFGTPAIITDPVNRFSVALLPGWYAITPDANAVAGVTSIANYDKRLIDNPPPGSASIHITISQLDAGQSFDQWLSDRRSRETSPEYGAGGVTLTQPQSYAVGRYTGVIYVARDLFSGERVMMIYLLTNDKRIVEIGLRPADSPILSDALSILSTLNVSSESLP